MATRVNHEREQYLRRAQFLYRAGEVASAWRRLLQEVAPVSQQEALCAGVSKEAWDRIGAHKVSPVSVFCSPTVLVQRPALLAYYRCLTGLSQKGARRFVEGYSASLEEAGELSEEAARKIAKGLNLFLSELLCTLPDAVLCAEVLFTVALMNYGTGVNGSWRNAIGRRASRELREMVAMHLSAAGAVCENKSTKRKLVLINNYTVKFGSEPDIGVYSPDGRLECAVEIKGGLDPAGALERYGAAKKSFDRALDENKAAETVYVAACITDEVRRRMREDRVVRREFDLIGILAGGPERSEFLQHLAWVLRLPHK